MNEITMTKAEALAKDWKDFLLSEFMRSDRATSNAECVKAMILVGRSLDLFTDLSAQLDHIETMLEDLSYSRELE